MYTGNVSSLRQLACEYAEQNIDRDTYLNNRGRLLDQLSGELPDEEDGEQTVRLPVSCVPSGVPLEVGIPIAEHVAEPPEWEAQITSQPPVSTEPSDDLKPRNSAEQISTIEPHNKYPAKKLGRHRTLIMAFWIVLGLGGITIYMIASGKIF